MYGNLQDILFVEGYRLESNESFKEANLTDLALLIILSVLSIVKCATKYNLDLGQRSIRSPRILRLTDTKSS